MRGLIEEEEQFRGLRVAIVHYWFVGRAGGERVVEAIAELFPQADLFCLVADLSTLAPVLRDRTLYTSFLQRVPGATKFHRHFLLLQPIALEQFDLSSYDLVISSESGPAKGVITSSQTCHICYCHSPMRYIWEMYPQYLAGMNGFVRAVFTPVAHYMRMWDVSSAQRVDYFAANSQFIASRIRKYYRRDSVVIFPPVDASDAYLESKPGDYYLAVGRLVDYKRFDVAVEACTRMGRSLHVVGHGPQLKKLTRMAGPTIKFLGRLSDQELRRELANCRALLFPGEEDFGIIPVEAQSFGRPVIAFASGGALETIRASMPGELPEESPTGVFFKGQYSSSLEQAILDFESRADTFSPRVIRQHSLQFDKQKFKERFLRFAVQSLNDFRARNRLKPLDTLDQN